MEKITSNADEINHRHMNGKVRVIKSHICQSYGMKCIASVAESMNDDEYDDIPCFFTHKEMQILEALQMTY